MHSHISSVFRFLLFFLFLLLPVLSPGNVAAGVRDLKIDDTPISGSDALVSRPPLPRKLVSSRQRASHGEATPRSSDSSAAQGTKTAPPPPAPDAVAAVVTTFPAGVVSHWTKSPASTQELNPPDKPRFSSCLPNC